MLPKKYELGVAIVFVFLSQSATAGEQGNGISVNSSGQLRFEMRADQQQFGIILANATKGEGNFSTGSSTSHSYSLGIFHKNYLENDSNAISYLEVNGIYSSVSSNSVTGTSASGYKFSSTTVGFFAGMEYLVTQHIALDGKAGVNYSKQKTEWSSPASASNSSGFSLPAAALTIHYYW